MFEYMFVCSSGSRCISIHPVVISLPYLFYFEFCLYMTFYWRVLGIATLYIGLLSDESSDLLISCGIG